jgi:hypothetical protein
MQRIMEDMLLNPELRDAESAKRQALAEGAFTPWQD